MTTMTEHYEVEILHLFGSPWERVLLFLWTSPRFRVWLSPDVYYATVDEALADVDMTLRCAEQAFIEARGEALPGVRVRPTRRWRVVRMRQTPWAEKPISQVIAEGERPLQGANTNA